VAQTGHCRFWVGSTKQLPCIRYDLFQQAVFGKIACLAFDWLPAWYTVNGSLVINPLITAPSTVLAIANPFSGVDHSLASWFHAHLTRTFVTVLRTFTEFGSSEWIALVLAAAVLFFAYKRWWPTLVTLIVTVPGGMLLNEWIKLLVHRHRPFVDGWFVDWSGYSFASGHTIGATLLYGQIALFIVPLLKDRRWRVFTVVTASFVVLLVGFSRIALGAHYFTDVVGAMFIGTMWLTLCGFASRPLRRAQLAIPTDVVAENGAVLVPVAVQSEIAAVPSR
jgi:membrane-associated phospholipid phosphatase